MICLVTIKQLALDFSTLLAYVERRLYYQQVLHQAVTLAIESIKRSSIQIYFDSFYPKKTGNKALINLNFKICLKQLL